MKDTQSSAALPSLLVQSNHPGPTQAKHAAGKNEPLFNFSGFSKVDDRLGDSPCLDNREGVGAPLVTLTQLKFPQQRYTVIQCSSQVSYQWQCLANYYCSSANGLMRNSARETQEELLRKGGGGIGVHSRKSYLYHQPCV